MAQENYVKGCSIQRPPLLESDGFCFWKARFETYVKSKDIDLCNGTFNIYEMVLDNDGVTSKITKEKVKSLALKAKVTREQTSDNSDSQGGSNEDVDEEEAEAFNLMAKNFHIVDLQKKNEELL
ncbi:hypothetical protein Tco_0643025 [Tanacetum coccineum]